MKIVINSYTKFNIALQHLLESLKENNINYSDVIVVIGGYYNLDNYDDCQYTDPTDYYNTGTMRIVESYPNLDLYKIKANWVKEH